LKDIDEKTPWLFDKMKLYATLECTRGSMLLPTPGEAIKIFSHREDLMSE
jgi:hypothetical protein